MVARAVPDLMPVPSRVTGMYTFRCEACGHLYRFSKPDAVSRFLCCSGASLRWWSDEMMAALDGITHLFQEQAMRGAEGDTLDDLLGYDPTEDIEDLPLGMVRDPYSPYRRFRPTRRELREALRYARQWGLIEAAEVKGRELADQISPVDNPLAGWMAEG